MKIREWVSENLPFLITLLFGMIALYTTFQMLVYRMDQIEARVSGFEEYVIPREVFESEIKRLEQKIDILIER